MEQTKEPFFTHDGEFYKLFFRMLALVALQNLVAYSVNMADNIMLGSYNQAALSGATTVNQIFFVIQSFATALGGALSTLSAQYWGKQDTGPIRRLTGIALRLGLVSGLLIVAACALFARPLLGLFTNSQEIISQGTAYLEIIQWSFLLFILSTALTSVLRSIGTVRISFFVSLISLVVNVSINYVLIFGKLGFPELGIRGAAVGTIIARILEFGILLIYTMKWEKKMRFWGKELLHTDAGLRRDYIHVLWPLATSQLLWALSVPMQTAILGHLSDDALAANAVASTFYQYLKVVVTAMATTTSVVIGNSIGRGDLARVRSDARTISIMDIGVGVILGCLLLVLRGPLLSLYSLTPTALTLASHLIMIMAAVMVGMSYQMPITSGILNGGGDVRFNMIMNLISVWVIVMPLSFAAAFWWKLPVEVVVLFIQSDQFFKGIPCGLRLYRYKWIHNLTQKAKTEKD